MILSSEDEIEHLYKKYNKKPFKIDRFVYEADPREIAKNYIFYILQLNEYIQRKNYTFITEAGFSNLILDWLSNINYDKYTSIDKGVLRTNLEREMLFISGVWVYYEFTLRGRNCLGLEKIKADVIVIEKKYKDERILLEHERLTQETLNRINQLKKIETITFLFRKELEILINTKGYTPLFYFTFKTVVDFLKEDFNLPKTKSCYLAAEAFSFFNIINKGESHNYTVNFYTQLKRVAKFEKIENFKLILSELTNTINSL